MEIMTLKTINIVEDRLKKFVELWYLCCMMFRWTNKFWNWCSQYQDIYDWISPLNKRSGILYTPYILWGFIFANFASRVLFANSTTRENKFTSDPDTRMQLVYVSNTSSTVHSARANEWMILISPTSVHDCSPPRSRIQPLAEMSWSPDSRKIRLAKYMAYTVPFILTQQSMGGNEYGDSRHLSIFTLLKNLKHKDSFGKSENLSKIFFAEILVFDHDYEGKSSSSNGLLWISFIFLK